MRSIQEQEHWDYEAGCRSELQNAFALSQREVRIKDDRELVKKLLAAGSHVVVETGPVFCPRTDATLGEYYALVAICCDAAIAGKVMVKRSRPDDYDCHVWAMTPAAIDDIEDPMLDPAYDGDWDLDGLEDEIPY